MTRQQKTDELLTRFRVVQVLSEKNGCRVIRVRHRVLGRDMILHSLPTAVPAYETLCRIRFDHLPEVYDVFTLDDGMIVLEEYVDGMTVAQMLEVGLFSRRQASRIVADVCDALTVLHREAIVHRDVKPENVLIGSDGRTVLIDFNASRRISGAEHDTVFMGTLGYAPPEQFGITESDARTDVYAVGVLYNVMLTGLHPTQRLAGGKAGRIVRKCTQTNSADRFQTARELADAL